MHLLILTLPFLLAHALPKTPKHHDDTIQITTWTKHRDCIGDYGRNALTNIFHDGRTQDLKRNACRSFDQTYRTAKSARVVWPPPFQDGGLWASAEKCKAVVYGEVGCKGNATVVYSHEGNRCVNSVTASVWVDCSGSWELPGATINETGHPPLVESKYDKVWSYPEHKDPLHLIPNQYVQAQAWQAQHANSWSQDFDENEAPKSGGAEIGAA